MNIVILLLFSLVSSFVSVKIETRTSKTTALRKRISSSVEIQTVKSNKNNTDSSTTFRYKDLKSKAYYINSTIYAKPS